MDQHFGMHFQIKLNVQSLLIISKIRLGNIFWAGLYLNELLVNVYLIETLYWIYLFMLLCEDI